MGLDVKCFLQFEMCIWYNWAQSMSGHSKWATIKRQKAANDAVRGKTFSKLSRAITLAVKAGGGVDINTNYKLRVAVEAARAENMPRDTIERAINKAGGGGELEEITYEGFGPGGVGVLVQTATDNRNRTAQELKSVFERSGGSLGGPGSVSFNFEPKGFLLLKGSSDPSSQMLSIIDLGVEDVESTQEGIEVYTDASEFFKSKEKLENMGFSVSTAELIQKPKSLLPIGRVDQERFLEMFDSLQAHDDVQRIYDNAVVE